MARLTLGRIRVQNAAGATVDGTMPSATRIRQSLFRILDENVLCSIATTGPGSRAHINTAYYSYSSALELYFLSHPGSRHCRNLAKNRSVAVTIFSSAQRWTAPDRGVQLFGTCRRTRGSSAMAANASYAARFPAYSRWSAALLRDSVAVDYQLYRIRVNAFKLLDEEQFGDGVFVLAVVAHPQRTHR